MIINTPILHEKHIKRGDTLLIATHNDGKARELAHFLTPYGFHIRTLRDEGLPAPDETGTTFEANAELKARAVREATGLWTLADDSGLEVSALNGLPGVDTAHYGGWEKLLDAMKDIPENQRQAQFCCVLALQSPDGTTSYFTGTCKGMISTASRGEKGFGYDPVFQPLNSPLTFAEMSAEEKQTHSHRGAALRSLCAWLELSA